MPSICVNIKVHNSVIICAGRKVNGELECIKGLSSQIRCISYQTVHGLYIQQTKVTLQLD